MWRRKNDVCSPKIGSPMSDNFSPTTRYSACGDVKMMNAPPKLAPPCLTIFRRLLNMDVCTQIKKMRSISRCIYNSGHLLHSKPNLDNAYLYCNETFKDILKSADTDKFDIDSLVIKSCRQKYVKLY